jgi:hypothetical protein
MIRIEKRAAWIIGIFLLCILLTSSPSAQDFSGWINLRGSNSENFEDGKKQSEESTFNQSYQLSITNYITRALTYNLNVRTRLVDTDLTDSEGNTSTAYQRTINPGFDLSLSTPVYTVSTGYQRDEQWSTARLTNESRRTFDNIYTRFNVSPKDIPSLSLQFDRGRDFDHLSDQIIDETFTQYTVTSAYELPSDALDLSYSISYSHDKNETPLMITTETISDNLNVRYDIGYSRYYWQEKGAITLAYQGNYRWNEQEQSVEETGEVLFRRNPFGGLYAQGTVLEPDVDILASTGWSSLVDGDFDSSANINLGTGQFHNIGIWIPSDKPVDRLYIYVDSDTSTDINLTDRENWEVYWSNFNQTGTWTEIPLKEVTVKEVNVAQDLRHRYEIEFLTPRSASYFKAVNLETVNALGVTDVFITEVEAHGTDTVPETGVFTDESRAYTNGFKMATSMKPHEKLTLTLDYSIDRSDEEIDSVFDSFTGTFKNLFSDSIDEQNDDFSSRVNRNYGASARWLTHRLLTTSLRYRRSEFFDSIGETDSDLDTYNISFRYTPLPTLGTNLIFTRNERFSFDEKATTENTVFLSVDSKLYRDIHMTTDLFHTQTDNFATKDNPDGESSSSSYAIRGIIDAVFTRELIGSFRYNLGWDSSDNEDSNDTQGFLARISYRPGRLINLSGVFSISSSNGDTTTTEVLGVDWLPLPAIKLSSSYRHSDFPSGATLDTFTSTGNWTITKFLYAWISYNYRKSKEVSEFEDHSVTANLNCRF